MRTVARPFVYSPAIRRGITLVAAASVAIAVFALPGIASATPSTVSVDGTSGTLTFHATSAAAMVKFQVDDEPALDPVTVTAGAAQLSWDSLGEPNIQHVLSAFDCSDATTCDTTAATTDFTLNNDVPVIASPTDGATLVGGVDITATFAAGSLKVLLDGTEIGTATASPFTMNQVDPGATGLHDIVAVQCSVDLTKCNGPSDGVQFNADGLHPTIGSFSQSRFSPNGDGVKDASTVSYTLERQQTVTLTVLDSTGTPVIATTPAVQSAGTHKFTWNGKDTGGATVPDGKYHVRLTSSADINGVTVTGAAGPRYVTVDTVRPSLSGLTGAGVTFYPYKDGYKDTFSPSALLSEGGTLQLVVKNSNGKVVRTISASKAAGRRSLTWDGRYSSGSLVAAGKYHWSFTATDAAGNHRTTSGYVVYVSLKKLVSKTKIVSLNGAAHFDVGRVTNSCTSISSANSDFEHGALLSAACHKSTFALASAYYKFKIPNAIKYGKLSLRSYGHAHSGYIPSVVSTIIWSPARRTWEYTTKNAAVIKSTLKGWHSFGTIPAAGHYNSNDVVTIGFGVLNLLGPSDYDIRNLTLGVTYYVLQ